MSWALFKQTRNPLALDNAIAHETNAAKAWRTIVTAAGDIYHSDLMMGRRGSGLSGHWKDQLAKIEKGLAAMIRQRDNFKPKPADITPITLAKVTDDTTAPLVTHKPIASAPAEKPLTITAEVRDPAGVKWVRLRCRSVTQFEDYRTLEMKPTGKKDQYRCTVPGEQIPARWDFMYLIEVMDRNGNGTIWPDLNERTPYVVVRLKR